MCNGNKSLELKAYVYLLYCMEAQKLIVQEAFETWRGDLEQNDDVCIIGVKV